MKTEVSKLPVSALIDLDDKTTLHNLSVSQLKYYLNGLGYSEHETTEIAERVVKEVPRCANVWRMMSI